LVSRDALNFRLIRNLFAIILMTCLIGLAAALTGRESWRSAM
jgi:hypothetical protein